jgi:membrane fusion protein, heavy metal efflux system
MKRIPISLLTILTGLWLGACSPRHEETAHGRDRDPEASRDAHAGHEEHGEEAGGHAGHDEHAEKAVVRLPESEWKEFGIEVSEAGPGALKVHVTLPGEVTVNHDRLAHIVPRFAGIAREVRKTIGDKVKEGEVLAVIEGNESLAPYEIASLIEGTVIEKHITLGEALGEDDEAYLIADLSTIWVNLGIYQKDLALIKPGQSVLIAAGHGIPDAQGTISYVGPVVDEHTRTGLARVVLPNPEGLWRPGLFVTARIEAGEFDAPLVVPKTALQTVEDRTSVFVHNSEGFKATAVSLGRQNDTHVEILSGLEAGQRYASRGAFTLKADLAKGAFGDGHAH